MGQVSSFVKFGMAATLAVAAMSVAAPASAQERLSLAERVARLEQQANGGGSAQSRIDTVNQIQSLQTQVQELLGQVEELKHQLGEARQRAKDQYVDLDSRIGRLEGQGATAPSSSANPPNNDLQDIQLGSQPAAADAAVATANASSPTDLTDGDRSAAPSDAAAPSDPAAEKAAYDEAFAALKDGRYAESARRFQAYVERYPNSDLTGNAYYWLGESYYVTQNYGIALETFQTLLKRYPQGQKAPDALLKTGYCQYELKQFPAAEATLNEVVGKYPDSTVARLAQGRLRALKLEPRR